MLSRREKLLVLPWEQRKYENHRRKVQSALPAIDSDPPLSRNHVTIKLKKRQQEIERCAQIEKNNLLLLRKLKSIMKTNRVDNCWLTPMPNFLNRVEMFYVPQKSELEDIEEKFLENSESISNKIIRKSNCLACTPPSASKPTIPEERIPWEPEKQTFKKVRSKSVPAKQVSKPVSTREKSANFTDKKSEIKLLPKNISSKQINPNRSIELESAQSIVFKKGSLVLSVNFPYDTSIKFKSGFSEKLISRGLCQCKIQN